MFGVDAIFLLKEELLVIINRIKKYIEVSMANCKKFLLYFNDIPSNIPQDKLIAIFYEVKKLEMKLKSTPIE